MEVAREMPIKAIASFTRSGNTSLYMSRHLGDVPIYAVTSEDSTLGRVTLFRNVTPLRMDIDYGPTDAPKATLDIQARMLDEGITNEGELIIMTFGTPMGESGGTNAMKIISVK